MFRENKSNIEETYYLFRKGINMVFVNVNEQLEIGCRGKSDGVVSDDEWSCVFRLRVYRKIEIETDYHVFMGAEAGWSGWWCEKRKIGGGALLVRDFGIEWCAMFLMSGGGGRGDLALGFQVLTEGKKSAAMVFYVFRFPVADEKDEIMEFGT